MINARHVRLLSKITLLAGAAMLVLALSSLAQAQQRFSTPEAAVDALAKAARSGDGKTIVTILGPGSEDLVSSGDPVADANRRQEYLAAYDAGHRIVTEAGKGATLIVGPNDWPFPIPVVQRDGQWIFDVAAGREEILARRIGENELSTMKALLAYYDAQNDYADMFKSKSGQAVYAQRVVSSPGKKDGLYWPTSGNEQPSPLGEAVAAATQRGYRPGAGEPFFGYYYKVLTRQGPAAPGGAIDYIAKGDMIGGFAAVAYPAEYGNSGIMTFMINHNGDIYEKDLGEGTARIASRITSFNPDDTWRKVVDTEK
ncbi:MAG TPA: DUF2950 domain-containing protein [Vicinamibacterales bacterium]|jgi:hypothetical protein|nr:DUF2950 domain-containing protein [Vicinamibacterales bacterium]